MTPSRLPSFRPALLGALLGLAAAGAAPAAENVVENPGFDTGISGWELTDDSAPGTLTWAPDDASGDPGSGSLEIAAEPEGETVLLAQCLGPLLPGAAAQIGASLRFVEGGGEDYQITIFLSFFESDDCSDPSPYAKNPARGTKSQEAWRPINFDNVIDDEAGSVQLNAKVRSLGESSEPFAAQMDDVFVITEKADGGDPDAPPEPDPDGWFTDPTYPDFRFNVEITAGETSRLGTREPFCLDETVCVSGAVPGRVEILMRIVGPKPNGRLWPTLFKASTSRFDVWIEQLSTGVTKHYVLEGAGPGTSELPGLFDRDGFVL